VGLIGKRGMALAAVALSGAIFATAAAAMTHDEYVAQVNPICKRAAPALKRIPSRIRHTGNPFIDSLEEAILYGKLLGKTLNKIERIPPAPGDEAAVAAWIGEGRNVTRSIKAEFRAFLHGKPKRVKVMIKRIVVSQRRASADAAALGLTACSRTRTQGAS
jgi:hypothetical protein